MSSRDDCRTMSLSPHKDHLNHHATSKIHQSCSCADQRYRNGAIARAAEQNGGFAPGTDPQRRMPKFNTSRATAGEQSPSTSTLVSVVPAPEHRPVASYAHLPVAELSEPKNILPPPQLQIHAEPGIYGCSAARSRLHIRQRSLRYLPAPRLPNDYCRSRMPIADSTYSPSYRAVLRRIFERRREVRSAGCQQVDAG